MTTLVVTIATWASCVPAIGAASAAVARSSARQGDRPVIWSVNEGMEGACLPCAAPVGNRALRRALMPGRQLDQSVTGCHTRRISPGIIMVEPAPAYQVNEYTPDPSVVFDRKIAAAYIKY